MVGIREMSDQLDEPVATWTIAPYAFGGPQAEMEKAAPLQSGETLVLASRTRCSTRGVLARPCFLRLTDRRLAIVTHYALHPDRLITIPPVALEEVALAGDGIRLRYRTAKGSETINLGPFDVTSAELDPEEDEVDLDWEEGIAVAAPRAVEVLRDWRNGRRAYPS